MDRILQATETHIEVEQAFSITGRSARGRDGIEVLDEEKAWRKPLKGESMMWKDSQLWMAKYGFAFVLALIACSAMHAQDVRTNYLPGTDFSKYHTYKWVTIGEGGHPDQILDAQIKQSIDSQLAAKGFTKAESDKADLLVGYQVAVTKEREWNGYNRGFGFPWPDSGIATSSTINVGTLVLGIYDPAAKQLVWTGSATRTIDDSKDPQKIQKNLNKAMQKLLKDFPPDRKRT